MLNLMKVHSTALLFGEEHKIEGKLQVIKLIRQKLKDRMNDPLDDFDYELFQLEKECETELSLIRRVIRQHFNEGE